MLLLNIVLALTWMAFQRSFTLVDFLVGFLFGFAIIALTQQTMGYGSYTSRAAWSFKPGRNYVTQTWRLFTFLVFGLWSIIKSNIDVAKIVLSPKLNIRPGIVAIPLDVQSDGGITTLANLITLTPGTVTLDVSSDKKTIYIHVINVDDPEALRRDTKQEFERRVMELLP